MVVGGLVAIRASEILMEKLILLLSPESKILKHPICATPRRASDADLNLKLTALHSDIHHDAHARSADAAGACSFTKALAGGDGGPPPTPPSPDPPEPPRAAKAILAL